MLADDISIIIIDDHKMIANALGNQLNAIEGLNVINVITDATDLKQKILNNIPDVILMDIRLGKYNGIELAKELSNSDIDTRIILMSGYNVGSIPKIAGIDAFVSKEESIESLSNTIKTVFRDNVYIFPHSTIENTLTSSEINILRLISEDKTRKEIANTLYISEKTVSNHISSIFDKLKVRSSVGAVVKGIDLGLINPTL